LSADGTQAPVLLHGPLVHSVAMQTFAYHPFVSPPGAAELRQKIRTFLQPWTANLPPVRRANSWTQVDMAFSRALAEAGFVAMTWPKAYGGHERSALERYIVLEELLAAGAPVGGHWIADRQTGPLLLRFGTEAQRARLLPAMARAELVACIGLSEPGAGSDLASVRTAARRVSGGWRIAGQKVWTTNAHVSDLMLALVRSDEGSERQDGLSQFLIDLKAPGVTVRPIVNISGEHDFNEVFLDDVFVPDDALVGVEGQGWHQVTAELSLERSGPERYLSSHVLLEELLRIAGPDPDPVLRGTLGRLTAELWTLRQMSMSTAARLAAGQDPVIEASMVKDLGNGFEQGLPQAVQALLEADDPSHDAAIGAVLNYLLQMAPSFSLRGGTREIMRGIIARGLGLR